MCQVPNFIGPNFSELISNNRSLASLSSYSRNIPRKEIKSALGFPADIPSGSSSRGLNDIPALAKSNLSNDPSQTSTLENNNVSRLRLKAQYIFNVFEKVDGETENDQEVLQHVSNSLVSTDKNVKKDAQSLSAPFDPYTLLKSSVVVAILCLIYFLGRSFWHDYSDSLRMAIQENLNRQDKCISHYTLNKCFTPIPPLAEACAEWAQCMQSDPRAVERTTLIVRIVARLTSTFLHALTFRELSILGVGTLLAMALALVLRSLFGGWL